MKASIGFIFFMLFLAGLAFVNLKGMKDQSDALVDTASELAGTDWRPTHIGETHLDDESQLTLHFNSRGGLDGYSGCNRFSGDYELTEGAFVAGPLSTTRMACPEPGNSFEISYLQALQAARTLSRTESRLAMHDDKGIVVVRFVATGQSGTDD